MKKFGVMGWPVKHSLSPAMHQAAFAELGIKASYELLEVPPSEIEQMIRLLPEQGYLGWNVTVPHKRAMSKSVDRLDREAELLESVNTVAVEPTNHKLTGYSTDGYGLAMAVREHFKFTPRGQDMAFIGGGGATRAAAVYMARQGLARLVLINRTREKIEEIANTIGTIAPACRVDCFTPDQQDRIQAALKGTPLLVQATSLGLQASDRFPLEPTLIPETTLVMDMIYGDTPFLKALRKTGHETADGLAMLLYQGGRSFTLWTGLAPPLATMRQALRQAMSNLNRQETSDHNN